MELVERLQRLGLTEYEAKAYASLLNDHMNSAARLSKKSGVPRTKIYETLESLQAKGWVRIYSGVPLLFKAVSPGEAIEKVRKEYEDLLDSVRESIQEASEVKDKFIILKSGVGLDGLKEEIAKARTVFISNGTADLIKRIEPAFREDADVKVVLFPGEKKIPGRIRFKESLVEVVCIVKNKEVPSTNVILDESRTFTVLLDPAEGRYRVDEMLHDDCSSCLTELSYLGWNVAKELE